ncbi:glycosyltransferase [Nitrincola sp.]|uniref:glycosyltransferase n=1 Tax=Nitrincola sp. TaxID=1926584 RepID=UPI003A8ED83F
MKILHALYSDRKGGLERAFINATKAMLDLGHQVELLVPRQAPFLHELDYPLPHHDFKKAGYYSPNAWLQCHFLLRKVAPDLIVTHNSRATCILGRASFGLNIPHLAFSHSNKTHRFKSADHLVVLTEEMKQHFVASGREAEAISVFPNVIERIPELPSYTERLDTAPVRLGFIGRLNEEKGLEDLLQAMALLKDSCSLELYVAGSGPDQSAIQKLAGQLGVLEKVHFAGWIEDIAGWLSEIDLAVLPSRYEPFGIVVLEAAAYGCPVISTTVAGPASQICDGVDGWLAEPGSPQSLAAKIVTAITNQPQWPDIRNAAYLRAQHYLMSNRLFDFEEILMKAKHS